LHQKQPKSVQKYSFLVIYNQKNDFFAFLQKFLIKQKKRSKERFFLKLCNRLFTRQRFLQLLSYQLRLDLCNTISLHANALCGISALRQLLGKLLFEALLPYNGYVFYLFLFWRFFF
jgi:hypothetical protein